MFMLGCRYGDDAEDDQKPDPKKLLAGLAIFPEDLPKEGTGFVVSLPGIQPAVFHSEKSEVCPGKGEPQNVWHVKPVR